jgi:hypothetical protein
MYSMPQLVHEILYTKFLSLQAFMLAFSVAMIDWSVIELNQWVTISEVTIVLQVMQLSVHFLRLKDR